MWRLYFTDEGVGLRFLPYRYLSNGPASEGMVGGRKQEMKKSSGPRPTSSERRNAHLPAILNTDATADIPAFTVWFFYFELLYVPQAQIWRPISLFSTGHHRWRKPMLSRPIMTVNVSRLMTAWLQAASRKRRCCESKSRLHACQRSAFNKQIPFSPV